MDVYKNLISSYITRHAKQYIYEKFKHTVLYLITILILQKHEYVFLINRIIQYHYYVNIVPDT